MPIQSTIDRVFREKKQIKFKNPKYVSKVSRHNKNVKQITAADPYQNNTIQTVDVPGTYSSYEAPINVRPQTSYCDLTGLEAKYKDAKTNLRYFSK